MLFRACLLSLAYGFQAVARVTADAASHLRANRHREGYMFPSRIITGLARFLYLVNYDVKPSVLTLRLQKALDPNFIYYIIQLQTDVL
uniref:Secreted protein n=1 Tax=Solanum lycopersicum TaxID=4081 RepID=A0A3Q7F2H1_SOLLC